MISGEEGGGSSTGGGRGERRLEMCFDQRRIWGRGVSRSEARNELGLD